MKQFVFICSALVLFAVPASGQKTKPWTEWTEKEATRILNDSAWGQTQTEVEAAAPTSTSAVTQTTAARREDQRISAASGVESGESKARAALNFRVRFLSAKPIRAAFVRMIELQGAAPERVALLRTFVDRDFAGYIVVTINIDGTDSKRLAATMQEINAADAATLNTTTYLERKDGKRLALADYRAPIQDGLGAKFVFPRMLDGKPFINENSGELRFVIEVGKVLKLSKRFRVADMIYEGKIEY